MIVQHPLRVDVGALETKVSSVLVNYRGGRTGLTVRQFDALVDLRLALHFAWLALSPGGMR